MAKQNGTKSKAKPAAKLAAGKRKKPVKVQGKQKPVAKPATGKTTPAKGQGQPKTVTKKTPPVKAQAKQKPVAKPAAGIKKVNEVKAKEDVGQKKASRKINRRRKSSGWAHTKVFPHAKHPARYRRKGAGSDDIEYITFTHSDVVDLGDKQVRTVPMLDNISPEERRKNKAEGKAFGENRSYAYPKVFVGKRSALHKETDKFDPVDFDKQRIETMFEIFPREDVPVTGGKSKYKKEKKPRQ